MMPVSEASRGCHMTPREFREARLKLGLSVNKMADVLSVDPRTIRRWQDSSQGVPGPVVAAISMMLRHHVEMTP